MVIIVVHTACSIVSQIYYCLSVRFYNYACVKPLNICSSILMLLFRKSVTKPISGIGRFSGVTTRVGGVGVRTNPLCGKCDVTYSYSYTNTTKLVLHLSYLVRLD